MNTEKIFSNIHNLFWNIRYSFFSPTRDNLDLSGPDNVSILIIFFNIHNYFFNIEKK